MSRLTVAHLVATTGRTGVEAHLRVLFEGLREREVRPILVCPQPGPLTEALEESGFEVRLAAPKRRAGVLELRGTAKAVRDADLIHAHGPRAQWWSAALRRTGGARRAVATLHEFGRSGAGSRGPRSWFDRIESWTLRSHDRLIAVSSWIRQRAVEGAGIPLERIDVVINSCPLMLDPPRPLLPPREPHYALAAARLQREKGIDVLLDALALLKKEGVRLPVRVLGEGVERERLEAQARALGIADQVDLAGWASDVPEQMRAAVLYLNPSRDEPCSVAVLEAMTLGVPIVGSTAGGNVELLADAIDPPLVAPEDAPALARAIASLLERSPVERDAIRHALQDRAYGLFSPRSMGDATVRSYERALGSSGGDVATGRATGGNRVSSAGRVETMDVRPGTPSKEKSLLHSATQARGGDSA